MRIRRNSSPADLSVMRDKALDLGYTWDVTKYPTPAWGINLGGLRYDRPLFDIPVDIWNRELRLWACDCAERVVHIYEDWARANLPERLDACRELIKASRDYANGLISEEELVRVRRANDVAIYATDVNGYWDANAAIYAATAYYAAYTVGAATKCAVYSAQDKSSEEVWQRGSLAQRLDKIASWHL